MMRKLNLLIILLSLLMSVPVDAQINDSQKPKTLKEEISENERLFQENPEQALKEIERLIKEAERQGRDSLELKLLANRAEYYYFLDADFEQMLNSAAALQKKAKQYNSFLYDAKAYKYRAQAYLFNELYDRSLEELHLGLKILENSGSEDAYIILEKANIHTSLANVYSLKKEYFSAIQSLLNSVKEHNNLKNPEWRRGTKFMDYANLGGAYLKVNLDSAEYYAQKSLSLKTEREDNHNQTYLNYIVLGKVNYEKLNYREALDFYKKAESIKNSKHFINTKELYEGLVFVYEKLDSPQLVNEYKAKLKDLEFEISQNQNKSLRKIIQDNQTDKERNKWWLWLIIASIVLISILVILYWKYISKDKKEEHSSTLSAEKYNELIDLLKQNDPTFLLVFEKEYPDFSHELLRQAPDLTNQEIEMLAMVKLNLSNKEIAQYKFIQHKTVQNRRHLIRKKLNLTSDTDLNKWIESM